MSLPSRSMRITLERKGRRPGEWSPLVVAAVPGRDPDGLVRDIQDVGFMGEKHTSSCGSGSSAAAVCTAPAPGDGSGDGAFNGNTETQIEEINANVCEHICLFDGRLRREHSAVADPAAAPLSSLISTRRGGLAYGVQSA
ncbi:hypothetical protein EYF80_046973 [Liparis tanakae]|uniref:Uncharacterized protein n=1 Tax=Liparis tanakae TaxID=230148 RepID=A0A4Z2FPX1_9TELE|nr:hypothetical protein EYF80_046973 [Liparis tanakae]